MIFELPNLPYAKNALAPHISEETMEYHYGKHHQTYVNNLNNLVKETEFANSNIEHIVKQAKGGIYNNAAQVYNHTFFWNCLSPNGGGEPTGKFKDLLEKNKYPFATFKSDFTNAATSLFGSGWVWVTLNAKGELAINPMSNAGNPLTDGLTPIFCIDVWEHTYYVDYRNARPKFIDAFWNLINWEFVNSNI